MTNDILKSIPQRSYGAKKHVDEFEKNQVRRYTNIMYEVWDIIPRNVLIDNDGDICVIDAELKRI